ncbi:MAG: MFS transporter [Alphaproteobacteria bacterium]
MPRLYDRNPSLNAPLVLIATVFPVSLAHAVLISVLALRLEQAGIAPWLIGLNTAVFPLATILTGPLVPVLLRWVNPATLAVGGMAVAGASAALMGFYSSLVAWFILRFAIGMGVTALWVVAEAWLNALAPEKGRGRIVAWYSVSLASGFAIGPQLVNLLGIDGILPFVVPAIVGFLTTMALLFIREKAPVMAMTPAQGVGSLLKRAPIALGLAAVSGSTEAAIFGLVPLFTVDIGLTKTGTLFFVSAFSVGSIILQPPLGWLIDHVSERRLTIILTLSAAISAAVIPYFAGTVLLWPSIVFWGGVVYGFYTLGLTSLGRRFPATELASANVVFVMAYQIGGTIGPPIVGAAMDQWGSSALLFSLAAVAVAVPCINELITRIRHLQVKPN